MKNVIALQLMTLVSSTEIVIKAGGGKLQFKTLFQLQAKNCNHGDEGHLHEPEYFIYEYTDIHLDDVRIPDGMVSMMALKETFAMKDINIAELMSKASDNWASENLNIYEYRNIYRETQKMIGLKENLLEINNKDIDYLLVFKKFKLEYTKR